MPAPKDIAGLIDHSLLRPDATYTKINLGRGHVKKGRRLSQSGFILSKKQNVLKTKYLGDPNWSGSRMSEEIASFPCMQIYE
jgi:hypothetical protein